MDKLTSDQLSTVIYALEGYCQGNDDDQLVKELEQIIKTLTA